MTNQTKIDFDLKGLDKLTLEIGDTYRARVGILGSHAQRTDGGPIDNATLGVIQMFGSITKKIPPRDFLFMPVQTHAREIVRAMSSKAVKAAMVAGDIKKVYGLLGAKALEFVLMGFETGGFGQWAPLKTSTLKARQRAQAGRVGGMKNVTSVSIAPLIESGQLRWAQTSDVVKKSDIE